MAIERDEWLYVWTSSEESARRFFGAPETAEVRCEFRVDDPAAELERLGVSAK